MKIGAISGGLAAFIALLIYPPGAVGHAFVNYLLIAAAWWVVLCFLLVFVSAYGPKSN